MVKLVDHFCFDQWHPHIAVRGYPLSPFEVGSQGFKLLPCPKEVTVI